MDAEKAEERRGREKIWGQGRFEKGLSHGKMAHAGSAAGNEAERCVEDDGCGGWRAIH